MADRKPNAKIRSVQTSRKLEWYSIESECYINKSEWINFRSKLDSN